MLLVVALKTCNADLIVELYAYGFTHVIKDETIRISEADCSSRSDDCTSTGESEVFAVVLKAVLVLSLHSTKIGRAS